MKIVDEREMQKTTATTATKKKTEKAKRDWSYSERDSAKWFWCAFKLGFLRLIYKASLILSWI